MTTSTQEKPPKKPRNPRPRGALSRHKGKVGERELVRLFIDHGFEAERAQQYKGGQHSDDIYCPEMAALGIHIECKRTKVLRLDEWLAQVEKDAGGNKLPTIFWRRDRRPFVVFMLASDFLALLRHLIDGEHLVGPEEEGQ